MIMHVFARRLVEHGLEARATTAKMAVPHRDSASWDTYVIIDCLAE
jgi:hypothetical protein